MQRGRIYEGGRSAGEESSVESGSIKGNQEGEMREECTVIADRA